MHHAYLLHQESAIKMGLSGKFSSHDAFDWKWNCLLIHGLGAGGGKRKDRDQHYIINQACNLCMPLKFGFCNL